MHYEWIGKPSEYLRKCLLSVSARLSLVGVAIPLAFTFHLSTKGRYLISDELWRLRVKAGRSE